MTDYNNFFTDEILHKDALVAESIDSIIYDLFGFMPEGFFLKNIRGSSLYDFLYSMAYELYLAHAETSDVRDNVIIRDAVTTQLYNNFGSFLGFIKTAYQGYNDYDSTYSLEGYRPGLISLLEASVNGGSELAVQRVGHAITGMGILLEELYDNPRWELSVNSGSIYSMTSDKKGFTDPTKSWIPDEWVGRYIQIQNNSFYFNKIDDVSEDWNTVKNYPILASGVGLVRVGNTLFGIGGKTAIASYDDVYSITVDRSGNTLTDWVANESLPVVVGGNSGITVGTGNRIYVVGGIDHTGSVSDKIYMSNVIDVNGGEITTWTETQSLPEALYSMGILFKDGNIFIAGGLDSTGTAIDNVYKTTIDAETGELSLWLEQGVLPTALGEINLTYFSNGKIYIFGGIDDTATYSASVLYATYTDGVIGDWSTSLQTLDTASSLISAVASPNFIFLTGAYDGVTYSGSMLRVTLRSNGELIAIKEVADITTSIEDTMMSVLYGTVLYSIYNDTTFGLLSSIDTDYLVDNYSFDAPEGTAIYNDYLYVADTGNDTVVKFRFADDNISVINFYSSYSGLGIGILSAPEDMTVMGSYVYVADTGNSRVVKLIDSSFVYHSYYSIGVTNISGITSYTDSNGRGYLFAVDSAEDTIKKIIVVGGDSIVGTLTGLSTPTKIACDGTNIYFTNTGNDEVLIYTVDLVYVDAITGLDAPNGISVIGDYIFISNTGADEILKYNKNTLALVYAFGSTGTDPDELDTPMGISTDSDFCVISDTGNNRVTLWKVTDSTLAEIKSNTHDTVYTTENLYALGAASGSLYYIGKSLIDDTTQVMDDGLDFYGGIAHVWGDFTQLYSSSLKTNIESLVREVKPAHTYFTYDYHNIYINDMGQSSLISGSYDTSIIDIVSGSLKPKYPIIGSTYAEATWGEETAIALPSGSYYISRALDVGDYYNLYDWYVDYNLRVSNDSSGSMEIRLSDYEDYWELSEWQDVSQDHRIYRDDMKKYMQYRLGIYASGSNDFEYRGFSLRAMD